MNQSPHPPASRYSSTLLPEKKRRDEQRRQLDTLRQQIPKLRTERPSAITTITTAIEHIQLLNYRIQELEHYISQSGMTIPPTSADIESQQFANMPTELQTASCGPLLNFLQVHTTSSPLKMEILPAEPGMPSIKKIQAIAPAPAQENSDPNRHAISHHILPLKRRDSAMILPTNDPNTFLFGKRDSLQNFFTNSMPSVFDDIPRAEFHCTKCRRGVENLIMIDCDSCHSWYHIRCVNIDPNQIPLQWRCNECIIKPGSISMANQHVFIDSIP